MPGASLLLLGSLFVLQNDKPATICTPAAFQAWFQSGAQGTLIVPTTVEQRARHFRYVFVGGFANEYMKGYFGQSAKELRARGIGTDQIHFIFPSSDRLLEGNCETVKKQFLTIAARGPERLVVIAHSRGASDSLAFALRNPEFVQQRVHALFMVQGAFGGSCLADYVMGEGSAMDRKMPLGHRMVAGVAERFEKRALGRGKHEGLTEMTRNESDEFWSRMREEHADAAKVVGPKTFYITTKVHPSRLRVLPKAFATYLQTYYGPNDGVVLLSDQTLPGLGTSLGVFEAGHADLTNQSLATRAPRRLRQALVQSVLMAVGSESKPKPEASQTHTTLARARNTVRSNPVIQTRGPGPATR